VVTQRFQEAVEVARRIEEIDPASYVNLTYVQALDCAGQHERALARLAEIESLLPAFPGVHAAYAQIYMHLERRDLAAQALLRLGEAAGWPQEQQEHLRATFAAQGADAIYRTLASAASPLPSPAIRARFHALLGEDDEALRLLAESVAARDMNALWIGADHSYDRLRSSPRFRELVRAVGLERDSTS
jgi:tetratricopeptide (TPR) repeat protein